MKSEVALLKLNFENMEIEICANSFEEAVLAKKYAINRIELCSALSLGGLTPSMGLVEQCAKEIEVHAIIRHQEGDFVYSNSDIEIMKKDIFNVKKAGGKGVVFGCLKKDNSIHIKQNKNLVDLAKELKLTCTFHRAFDFCQNPEQTLEQIIQLGFDRVLTSGQKPRAQEGIQLLKQLVMQSHNRIQIMAGSGINPNNTLQISQTGVNAIHFSIHQNNNSKNHFGMGKNPLLDENKIAQILQVLSKNPV